MAIVTRQEFADMCSIDGDALRSYISRKKVITCGDGGKQVDTDNPINKAFKQQRKAKANIKKENADLVRQVAMSGPPPQFTPQTTDDELNGEGDDDLPPPLDENLINAYLLEKRGKLEHSDGTGGGMQQWILMELKGRAKLVTLKAEREKLMVEKAAGRLLPVELVTNVHKGYHKHIFSHLETGMETIASKFCEIMAGGDQQLYTRVLEECRQVLESTIHDAGVAVNEDIKRIIINFSQSRNLVN